MKYKRRKKVNKGKKLSFKSKGFMIDKIILKGKL